MKEIADALADNATLTDVTSAISTKANAADVYTKGEADAAFQPVGNYLTSHQDISGKANVGDSYTKAESDAKYLTEHQDISGKANAADVYTKSDIDDRDYTIATSLNDLNSRKANADDVYTKAEVDALIAGLVARIEALESSNNS